MIPINACPKAAYISCIIAVFITVLHMHLLHNTILVTSVLYTTTQSNADFLRVHLLLDAYMHRMNSIPILIHHIHNYYTVSFIYVAWYVSFHYLTIVLVRHLSVEYYALCSIVIDTYARNLLVILCTLPLNLWKYSYLWRLSLSFSLVGLSNIVSTIVM